MDNLDQAIDSFFAYRNDRYDILIKHSFGFGFIGVVGDALTVHVRLVWFNFHFHDGDIEFTVC